METPEIVWRWNDEAHAVCHECGRFVTGAWTCWLKNKLRWIRQVCGPCAEAA